MKYFVFFLFCLTISSLAAQESGLAIRGINIIRPKDKKIIADQTVLILNGKISAIGKTGSVMIPAKTKILEAKGKYLMPGIAEMHAHIPVPETDDHSIVDQTLFLYLSNGVTTIRGMLGNPFHLGLRNKVIKGEQMGPRIYTSSPSFSGNTIPDIPTAEKLVRQYKTEGYDFLKIHPGIKKPVYDAMAKIATELKIPYAGHVPVEVGLKHALSSGQVTIDHLDGFIEAMAPPLKDLTQNGFFGYNLTDQIDSSKLKSLIDLILKKKAWVVPTQSLFTRWFSPDDAAGMMQAAEMAYMPSKTRYAWLQNKSNLISSPTYNKVKYDRFLHLRKKILFELDKAGANLLLGSDAPQVMNVPGFSLQHEMQSWSDAGISNWKILQAATSEVARFFKAGQVFGDISKGLSADLILLSQNPVEDIKNMSKIEAVIYRGNLISKEDIDYKLKSIALANQ